MSVRTKPRRRAWSGGMCAIGVVLMACLGCAGAKQTQYFEVVYENPDTGMVDTNYYRMTISGGTHGATVYKFKAAYMNAAAVDVLEGKGVFIPEADLPRAADESFQRALGCYYTTAKERAERLSRKAKATEATDRSEALQVGIARQVWFSNLSAGDVVAMGQVRDTDPHIFRKLVFYATAKNIDLEKAFGPQIDAIVSKVETLARREQQRAKARKNLLKYFGKLLQAPTVDPQMRATGQMLIGLFGGDLPNETPTTQPATGGEG